MSIGTPVYIGSDNSTSSSNVIITTTAASGSGALIFVAIHAQGGHLTGVSDSAGNAYSLVDTPNSTEIPNTAYSDNSSALGIGGTITLATTVPAPLGKRCHAISVSGIASTSALDVSNNTASGTGTAATSVGSGTLASNSEILFGLLGTTNQIGTITASSGFTMITPVFNGSCNVGYQIVSASSPITWAPTWSLSQSYGSDLVSFLAAASGDVLLGQACL